MEKGLEALAGFVKRTMILAVAFLFLLRAASGLEGLKMGFVIGLVVWVLACLFAWLFVCLFICLLTLYSVPRLHSSSFSWLMFGILSCNPKKKVL